MARVPSNKTKIAQGRGTGIGADYKPFIMASECPSRGTTEVIPDWKHGRGIQCLSQGEVYWYYALRWDDKNVDIREQFPLWGDDKTNAETLAIAAELGYRHPGNSDQIMTTDFLSTERGGGYHAYSVKLCRERLTERDKEKLRIEAMFWAKRNVPFTMLFKEDANAMLATNIRLVTQYYDANLIHDDASRIKHLIATKQYEADLTERIVDVKYLNEIERVNKGLPVKEPANKILMIKEGELIW